MRYRLRTLLMVLALGPPVLAGMWFAPIWLLTDAIIPVAVLMGFAGFVILEMAVLVAIPLLALRIYGLVAQCAQRK